ncbi:MAG: hypothetical protein JRC86_00575 [Deltaproteobacteria bacterium]|nr:hypothetical protein [Deltaproteobacteria bacterium]
MDDYEDFGWEDEQYGDERPEFTVDEDVDDCDECTVMFSDACQGCAGYARRVSLMDPTGVFNGDGECIGRLPCGCEDAPCCGCS